MSGIHWLLEVFMLQKGRLVAVMESCQGGHGKASHHCATCFRMNIVMPLDVMVAAKMTRKESR